MKKLLSSLLMLFVALTMNAQMYPEKLPVDSAVRVGHLENGLTYYIRHNEQPKQRCEFHIAQCVGAILEEDNQNGLAHFLEHMAFNGTQHFPGKGIIDYFESIGVNFGGNINAYTAIDETVYRLSDVPTYREGIIDSALLVMHDWSCGLLLQPEEIDAERGVIREEWRTRFNAGFRMYTEALRQMYPGSQYAKRNVIGDTAVINNFTYDALRAYYHKWYGPGNQAIVVVGDIDVDQIEKKIQALWADVPANVKRSDRILYSVDDNVEPIVAIVTDKEAQGTSFDITCKHEQLPEGLRGTAYEYILNLEHSLIAQIMSERFNDIRLKPESPIHSGGVGYGEMVKRKDAFMSTVSAKEGHEKEAYVLLLKELEKMSRFGFTKAELDRAKASTLSSYEKSYNERDTRQNITLTREYIRNFLNEESIPGIEWEYEAVRQALELLDVSKLNELAKTYLTEDNVIISIYAPEKEGVVIPTRKEAIQMFKERSHFGGIEAPVEEKQNVQLVKKEPKAGKIVSVRKDENLGTTEWLMKNGIKVIFYPTDYKKDEISMRAFSQGGYSLIDNVEDLPSAIFACNAVDMMGKGEFSAADLRKVLAGKNCWTSFSVSEFGENVNAGSCIKDFETMLQLMYLGFTAPREDNEAFSIMMQSLRESLANRTQDPKNYWRDSISMMGSDHSPRTILFTEETLNRIDMKQALKFYKERFANPGDFTFMFVGNINPDDEATKAAICKWLGGLKTKKTREVFIDRKVRAPKGIRKNYFTRPMQTNTACNRIQYTSYDMGEYTLEKDVNMEMIGRVLSTRYLESIREREGGSYGVGVSGGMNMLPVPSAVLLMQFDTDPDKQTRLMEIIHEEVKTIVDNGPLETDVQKERESMLKDLDENIERNGWWMGALYQYYRWNINLKADYRKAVENITPASVQRTLKKFVEAGNMFEVVMSPVE
ncbi:MAG: insulinase family protein [Paludibacteraceae bacterium]|nr:insulinase family protein [Paludibacteraceae bacterium]